MTDNDLAAHLARRFIAALNGNDNDYDTLVAPLYHEHARAPFGDSEPGVVDGPSHIAAVVASLRTQHPDLVVTVEDIAVDGDHVALRAHVTGTNLGSINGIVPPTGRTFASQQSHWFVVHDQRLAEHWATRDDLTAMLQLGLVAPASPR
jgi:predicted ester cyclase